MGVTLLSIVLAVVLGGLLVWVKQLCSLYFEYGTSRPDGARLPKGSLGWPIVGESLAFARDPKAFGRSRIKRYGSVFKSSVFLRRAILGTTPEFARFVSTNSKLFLHTVPDHIANIAGRKSVGILNGPSHTAVKKLVWKSIGPEAIRSRVQSFETIILENLALWDRAGTVIGVGAAQKIAWDTSNWILFNDRHTTSTPEGKENFENFKQIMRMFVSLPVKLPGTAYSKGMKARTALRAHFRNLIEETKGQSTTEGVFFNALLAARDDPEGREELKELDDEALTDNVFVLNFTAYDSTATTLVWILKLLIDHPEVFRRIQAEQQEILNSKDPSVEGPRLTWEDTRKMEYTHKFLQEVQRYLSQLPGGWTEATEDVTYEGHLIPKGWLVITLWNMIHSDPAIYPDLSFNPDRFDVSPKPYTFLPFGSGPHMCPGVEMAKLIGCIFAHHVTTTYVHERVGPDQGMEYDGFIPKPRGGYPIKFGLRK